MKRFRLVIGFIWLGIMGFLSPVWFGLIYMDITGHGKGFGYDMGSEAEVAVFFGVFELVVWLAVAAPVAVWLCRKCYGMRPLYVVFPVLTFILPFCTTVFAMGWGEFLRLFGIG